MTTTILKKLPREADVYPREEWGWRGIVDPELFGGDAGLGGIIAPTPDPTPEITPETKPEAGQETKPPPSAPPPEPETEPEEPLQLYDRLEGESWSDYITRLYNLYFN